MVYLIGKLDPENMGLAFEIPFLSRIGDEILGRGKDNQHSLHTPLFGGTSLFGIPIYEEATFFSEFFHQKMWK